MSLAARRARMPRNNLTLAYVEKTTRQLIPVNEFLTQEYVDI
jgi:hypothetical protein